MPPARQQHENERRVTLRLEHEIQYVCGRWDDYALARLHAQAPLLAKRAYNHDSAVFTFGLPEGDPLVAFTKQNKTNSSTITL